jgi:predicted O-methyltransferase YrrM
MPQMMHLRGENSGGACLAVPSYGAMSPAFVYALAASMRALTEAGVPHELLLLAGNCHVDDARNSIARRFLETACTDLVFIDADVIWRPNDLARLLTYDRDVVAGIYPLKQDAESYPVRHLQTPYLQAEADGLLEVESVPTGFLRIRRGVIEALVACSHDYFEQESDTTRTPLIFERRTEGHARFSGDYVFCRKWREVGGRIFIDPEMRFDHAGEKAWRGCYGAYLRRVNRIPMPGLRLIARGEETPETLKDLREEWGNPYAASPDLLAACVDAARKSAGDILEFGSGLTSLAMAAANPRITVHAIEHDPVYLERTQTEMQRQGITNLRLHLSPLTDHDGHRWYSQAPEGRFALILVDGPPRELADRQAFSKHCDVAGADILFDDADADLQKWGDAAGRPLQVFNTNPKYALSSAA